MDNPNYGKKIRLVSDKVAKSQFIQITNNQYFFLEKNDKVQEIKRIKVAFGFFTIETVIRSQKDEDIVSFNVDQNQPKIILLTSNYITKAGIETQEYTFKIYEKKLKDYSFAIKVNNIFFINLLRQNHFTLLDGHMYTQNTIVKIRYDLIENKDFHDQYTEADLIDTYNDIIKLDKGKGETICSSCPIVCTKAHR